MPAEPGIGTRIKKRRQVLRLTQEDLAAVLGVSKSTVANWETGKHFPRRYLGAVEQVLGISLDGAQPGREDDYEARYAEWEQSVMDNPRLPDRMKRDLIGDSRAGRAARAERELAGQSRPLEGRYPHAAGRAAG